MTSTGKSIVIAAAILGSSIVATTAMYLVCNRYTVAKGGANSQTVYLINNLTGSVKGVYGDDIWEVTPEAD